MSAKKQQASLFFSFFFYISQWHSWLGASISAIHSKMTSQADLTYANSTVPTQGRRADSKRQRGMHCGDKEREKLPSCVGISASHHTQQANVPPGVSRKGEVWVTLPSIDRHSCLSSLWASWWDANVQRYGAAISKVVYVVTTTSILLYVLIGMDDT